MSTAHQPQRARRKEMACVDASQFPVASLVEADIREDRDAQADLDVCLAHIGIDGAKDHPGLKIAFGEGMLHEPAATEALVVGDQRIAGDRLESQRLQLEQGVGPWDNHAAVQSIARKREYVFQSTQRLGANGDVRSGLGYTLDVLSGRPLPQNQADEGYAAATRRMTRGSV